MAKKIVSTSKAPAAIGPYSQAVQAGSLLFVSGQIPIDPGTGELVTGDIAAQTTRVMQNIKAIIEAADATMDSIVKCTIYLKSMSAFAAVNQTYGGYFTQAPPARATVEVSTLPKNVDVEIDAIAAIG